MRPEGDIDFGAMRLVALRLHGYRRFEVQSTLDLTPRVIALVGPNEAGKSTVLRALEHVTSNGDRAFTQSDFTERTAPSSSEQEILSALFEVEDEDRAALEGIPGGASIRLYRRWYRAGGKPFSELIPSPGRPRATRGALASSIDRLLTRNPKRLQDLLDQEFEELASPVEDPEQDDPEPVDETPVKLREALTRLLGDLTGGGETLLPRQRSRIRALASVLAQEIREDSPAYVRSLSAQCAALADEHEQEHPATRAREVLSARRPAVRVLRESDRQLESSYAFDEYETPPDPLRNLLQLAGVSWDDLREAAAEPGNPKLATLITRANRQLRESLHGSWRQAQVSIELREQQGVLNIFPYDAASDTHSRIEDRSDGFRSFLALLAFTTRHSDGERRLILGIDEAELHLHYDAQAALVRVLTQQRLVPQIIYSTHSAGCLPEDLGSAIRVVRTIEGDRSVIDNGFWSSNSAGFTPLLMAMGAGAVAFTPARSAIITEGPSDALLLPALFRAAMGYELNRPLGLQVVGGLAWTPPPELASLEAEASRVVYLADGDADGSRYRDSLLEAGVPRDHIFAWGRHGNGFTVEDFLHRATYVEVVNDLLVRLRDYDGPPLRIRNVPPAGAAKAVERWMRTQGVDPISKTAIAENVLRVARASLAYIHWTAGDVAPRELLRRDRAAILRRLYARIRAPLGLAPLPTSDED